MTTKTLKTHNKTCNILKRYTNVHVHIKILHVHTVYVQSPDFSAIVL